MAGITVPALITDCDFEKGPNFIEANQAFFEIFQEKVNAGTPIRKFLFKSTDNIRSIRKTIVGLKEKEITRIFYQYKFVNSMEYFKVDVYPILDENGELIRGLFIFHPLESNQDDWKVLQKTKFDASINKLLTVTSETIPNPPKQIPNILTIITNGLGGFSSYYLEKISTPHDTFSTAKFSQLKITYLSVVSEDIHKNCQCFSIDWNSYFQEHSIEDFLENNSYITVYHERLNFYSIIFPVKRERKANCYFLINIENKPLDEYFIKKATQQYSQYIGNLLERYSIRKELEIFEQAIRQSEDGIIITDGNLDTPGPEILYVNDAFVEMTGYSREELIGATPRIFQGKETDISMIASLKATLRLGDSFSATAVNYKKDGTYYYVRWHIHPIKNPTGVVTHFISLQRNITQEVKSEKNFNKRLKYEIAIASISQLLLQPYSDNLILEDALEQIILFADISSSILFEESEESSFHSNRIVPKVIRYKNSKIEPIGGFTLPDEWKSTIKNNIPVISYLNESDYPSTSQILNQFKTNTLILIPIYCKTKSDGIYYLGITDNNPEREWQDEDLLMMRTASHLIGAYIDRENNLQELQLHRDKLQEMVDMKTADLALALKKAELANNAKSDFLANMSHELRTPLNSIIGFTKLIQVQDDNPDYKKYLEYINKSGIHLLKLINEILDMSKIESGRLEINNTQVPILQSLDLAIESLIPQAGKRGLNIIRKKCGLSSLLVMGEEKRLRQIFLNLLSNAVKFADKNTDILVEEKLVFINNRDFIKISVQNFGKGIAPDDKERIFEKFIQLPNANDIEIQGTGLGLPITKLLTETMQGNIDVYSEETFTVFTVQFPIIKNNE